MTSSVPHRSWLFPLTAMLALAGCGGSGGAADPYPVDPKTGLRVAALGPLPPLPEWPDNPPTDAKKELGRALFSDPRLSGSGTAVCGNCHLAVTDFQDATPLDAPDRSYPNLSPTLPRHAPSLLNVVYAPMLRWDGSYFTDLFDVAVLPFAEPNMNVAHLPADMPEVVDVPAAQQAMYQKLTVAAPGYVAAFQQAFGQDIRALTPAATWRLAGKALAVYLRVAVSRDAPFDRWNAGDDAAMDAAAVRGLTLFRAQCSTCHSGPLFSDFRFHNVSTSPPDASGKRADEGRFLVTGDEADRGAFLTPMLRHVSNTSPYLHDGSQTTLAAVIRHLTSAAGRADPLHDRALDAMRSLSADEVNDVVQFLKALKGQALPAADLAGADPLP